MLTGGMRRGVSVLTPLLLQACLSLHASAQACPNDGQVTFHNEVGGVVTLNPPNVGNIVRGGSSADRATRLGLGGEQTGRAQGARYVVDTIPASRFPDEAEALRASFGRTIERFMEVNYSRGQYVFADRADLNARVSFTIPGNEARSTAAGSSSAATLSAELNNLNAAWYGGSNSLRRLSARVRFTYSDFRHLEQPGAHRANLGVCVEINGAI